MARQGATTGFVLMSSALAAFVVGAGVFAASNMTRPEPLTETPQSGPNVTLAKYDLLNKGMSFQESTHMLCREGKILSSCTLELKGGRQVETNMYIYENPDGSNCMLLFQDQILRVKTQCGLK